MERRNVLTGLLCAGAAVAASAVMTVVVPPTPAGSAEPERPPAASTPPPGRAAPPQSQSQGGGGAKREQPAGTPAYVGTMFENGLDGGHFCTATVVRSPGRNLIVTAGHCLADGRPGGGGAGALFAPAFSGGSAPFGTWRIEEVFQDPRWSQGGDDAYDLAFARLAPDDRGRNVEDVTGGAELDTSGRTGEQVTVTGYPSDRDVPRTCTATATLPSPTEQRFDCPDFPAGTSGSAWIARDGRIVGVLTGGDTDDRSTSTVLGEYAAALYHRATAR
ncbi:trypsin-like peptidase domain-containing protein [Streptomyces sp. NPDC012888]|uniref:trypsin-like serine peptidase n=1 Tax=Streptomyces sp. NPDC012888 TaxID=3364855 RepID=UPI0036982892